jgi:carbon monoxide dehydrogenase subunit G
LTITLEFKGTEQLGVPRGEAFKKLTDPEVLSKSIPDAQGISISEDGEIKCDVKVKLSVVQSTMHVTMKITKSRPDTYAKVQSVATGAGSRVEIEALFNLSGEDAAEVQWSVTARLSGLISGLGSGVLRSYGSKLIEQIVGGVKRSISY